MPHSKIHIRNTYAILDKADKIIQGSTMNLVWNVRPLLSSCKSGHFWYQGQLTFKNYSYTLEDSIRERRGESHAPASSFVISAGHTHTQSEPSEVASGISEPRAHQEETTQWFSRSVKRSDLSNFARWVKFERRRINCTVFARYKNKNKRKQIVNCSEPEVQNSERSSSWGYRI